MSDEQQQHYPSGHFAGDMSRNEVEMDLSKFMEMLQENAALKLSLIHISEPTRPY